MLKILSWNIRQGGANRKSSIVNFLIDEKASMIVLSEYRNNAHGNFIRSKLLSAGYRYQFASYSPENDNSVLIVSKIMADGKLFNTHKEYQDKLVLCEFEAFNLLGVYLPHKKKHQLFDDLKMIAKLNKPGILTGDFNTGKNGIDQKGNSFWYENQLFELEKLGYSDAYRHLHPDKQEYSWYSHQGNGYRYDHFYISNELLSLVQKCYYIHEWRNEGLSDHSPMILELG